ncbi:MAG: F0F1 ATP synthase subunit B [Pseudomonadota bacterium]
MFHDPTFWVLVAFVIFFLGVFRPVVKLLGGGLDKRRERIQIQLEEAHNLREEAQRTLAEYKRKQRDAVEEAEQILRNAKHEADRLREQAAQDLELALKRRTEQAEEKIRQAEANALQEVRAQAVDLAIAATGHLLTDQLDPARAEALIDQSIQDVGAKLN